MSSGAGSAATTARARPSPASGPSGSETASSWFGRTAASSPAGPVDHVEEAAAVRPDEARARTTPRALVGERRPGRCASRRPRAQPAADARAPSIHSALTSTGLPARGVTGTAVDARVHPRQRPALGALAQQAVGRVDADAEAGAVRRGARTISSTTRRQLVAEVVVAGHRDVPADRVDEPERRRRPCCTRATPVSAVFASMPSETRRGRRRAAPRGPRRRGPCSGRGPRTRSSGRATTRRTTGSRRRRSGRPSVVIANWSAASTSCASTSSAGAPRGASSSRARARAAATIGRRRRELAVERRGRRGHLVAPPGASSTPEASGRPDVLAVVQARAPPPRGARTPRYHSPPALQPAPATR